MASSMISSATVATVSRSTPAQASMVAPFTGLKSTSAFPVTRKTNADITSLASNGGRVQCMQVKYTTTIYVFVVYIVICVCLYVTLNGYVSTGMASNWEEEVRDTLILARSEPRTIGKGGRLPSPIWVDSLLGIRVGGHFLLPLYLNYDV